MTEYYGEFCITDNKILIQIESVYKLLNSTYWAADRSVDIVKKSIQNSVCYGVYKGEDQVGFARVVSDFATFYWLGDVVIDENYRSEGLGKKLVEAVVYDDKFVNLKGVLATNDAHKFYSRYGFELVDGKYMIRTING